MKPYRARDVLYKVIPTDTRYQTMRIAQRGADAKKLRQKLKMADSTIGAHSKNLRKEISSLKNSGLASEKGGIVSLTPFGKKVFNVTSKYFYGCVPKRIIPAAKHERVIRGAQQQINWGPLTETLSGKLGKGSLSIFLDIVDEHAKNKMNWVTRAWPERKEIKPMEVSNLLRQKFIESEIPVRFKRCGATISRRGIASAFVPNQRVLVLSGDAYRQFYDFAKKLEIGGETGARNIELPVKIKGAYSQKEVASLQDFLSSHGIDKSITDKITTPTEILILANIATGQYNQSEMARQSGSSVRAIFDAIRRLRKKGLIKEIRKPLIRVTFENPETKAAVNYLQALEKATKEELERNPALRRKLLGA